MNAKKGVATKVIIGVLLVVIVCMGAYIVHLTSADNEPPETLDVPENTSAADATVTPATSPAVETELAATPEPDADNTVAAEVKTGFTLDGDIVYAIEDAPMWSDYNTDSENVGTLPFGDGEVRLGQGYGEAEGWSKFLPTADIGVVYIENKYLSTEKPVSDGTTEIDSNAGATNNNPTKTEPDGSPALPDSETNNDSANVGNQIPQVDSSDNKDTESNDDRNADQANTGVLISFDDLVPTSSDEGICDGGTTPVDLNTGGSNTDHDYSGITIGGH